MSSFQNTGLVHFQAGTQIFNGNVNLSRDEDISGTRLGYGADAANSIRLLDDNILASLAFPQMFERRKNVDVPHNQTCQWITNLDEYQNWRAALRGLLWIKGKPGSGKSTLMSHLYSSVFKQQSESDIKLEFFFSARGAPLQRTPLGMLRSLVNQIFYQDSNVRQVLRTSFQEQHERLGGGASSPEWELPELKEVFLEMVSTSAQNHQVTIFIDALDEAGHQAAADTARYFHRVNDSIEAQGGSARICISCRHYPVPSTTTATEIHVESYNGQDIRAYVQGVLHLHDLSVNLMYMQQSWLGMVEDLVKMARGVFQWVILVVPMVATWIGDGETPDEIREHLKEVPEELKDIYEHIIKHVILRHNMARSLRLFQWVTLAVYPLSITAIRDAMSTLDMERRAPEPQYNQAANSLKPQRDMRTSIRSWSGGLIEVVDSGDEQNPDQIVQVIHQSVNEFLADAGLSILIAENRPANTTGPTKCTLPDTSEAIQISHGVLYLSCLKTLCAKAAEICLDPERYWRLQCELLYSQKSFHFLRYASFHCLKHAENAKQHRSQDLESESNLLNQALILIRNPRSSRDSPQKDGTDYLFYTSATILHMAAAAGLEDLVHFRLHSNTNPQARDKFGWIALHFAVEKRQLSMVKTLVEAGSNIQSSTDRGATPLLLAAKRGYTEIFAWLMAQGAQLDTVDHNGECALYAAAHISCLSICNLCIDAGVDVNTRGGKYGFILQAAAANFRPNPEVIRRLIQAGADVNAQGGEYGTAIQAAADNNGAEAIILLLEAGADIDAQGGTYGTALQAAASRADEEIIELLLKAKANVHVQAGYYGHALQAAAAKGKERSIHLLLESGADVNAQGGQLGNALQAAALGSDKDTVQQLLKAGANVKAQGGYYGTALQAAAHGGGEAIMKILLEAGAEVNAQGGHYGNALQAAAHSKDKERIQLLLRAGADINAQGGFHGSALQAAATERRDSEGGEEAVRLLIQAGADVNAPGGNYGSAVAAALTRGSKRIAAVLMEAGAIPGDDVKYHLDDGNPLASTQDDRQSEPGPAARPQEGTSLSNSDPTSTDKSADPKDARRGRRWYRKWNRVLPWL